MSAFGPTFSINFAPPGRMGQEESLIEQLSSISLVHDDPRFHTANRLMAVSFMHKMADCCSKRSLEHIAANPNTPASMLSKLASHDSEDVRVAVAENPNCPRDLLLALVRDRNGDVRYSLAENCNLPMEILELLCEDENPYVSSRAMRSIVRQRSSRFTAQAARLNTILGRTANSERGLKRFITTLTNLARIGTDRAS